MAKVRSRQGLRRLRMATRKRVGFDVIMVKRGQEHEISVQKIHQNSVERETLPLKMETRTVPSVTLPSISSLPLKLPSRSSESELSADLTVASRVVHEADPRLLVRGCVFGSCVRGDLLSNLALL